MDYVSKNKVKVSDKDLKKAINKLWKLVNKNGDKKITCLELGQAVFSFIDENGDGTLNSNELMNLVQAIAKAMKIRLAHGSGIKVM